MRSPSPCANLYNTRLDTPQAMCALHVALRGIHPRAKMRRSSNRVLKKSASGRRDGPVSPLCSRNARPQKALVGRAQWETHPGHPGATYTSKLGWIILNYSLRFCLGKGASLGEEAVLADSGREGEVVARVGGLRRLAF